LAPCSCDVVAVGGELEPCGRTTVGAVESLLTSPCFRKGLRAAVVMEHAGRHDYLFTGASQMGRRSCSSLPELARGRVMMAPPYDVVGPSPRSGEAEAPPRSRSSLSSEVEVKSEPRVRRGGDRLPRPRLCPSPGVGRGGVRRLLEPRLSPSPEVGRGGVHRLPKLRLSPSPGVGRGRVRRLPEPRLSPSPGVGRSGVHRPASRLSLSPRVGRGGASYGARGWT
jgi:hypothetical protein